MTVAGRRTALIAASLVVGLALRAALVVNAPRWGYTLDHFNVVGIGLAAGEHGIFRIYSVAPDEMPVLRETVFQDGRPVTIERRSPAPPNYPPISQVLFWLQSAWLRATVSPLVVNTPGTRLVTSVAPMVGELATAIGVGLLVAALSQQPALAVGAGVLTWLAPPLMLNTAFWGQYDALLLAPAVFSVLAMVRGRWLWAGVFVGLALLAKPQGLLLAPIAAFAALVGAVDDSAIGVRAFARRLLVMGAVAGGTFVVVSAPWLLTDGLALIRRCFWWSLFEMLPYTTLEAFNLWYLIALFRERAPIFDVLAATASVGGLSYDTWGRLLLAIALMTTGVLCWRRRDRPDVALVLFASLWLWSVFIWPTRIHERFILYGMPFTIAAAAVVPRLRPVLLALLIVSTMEHSWTAWRLGPPVGSFDQRTADRLQGERFRAYWKGRPVTLENAKAGPKPEDTVASYFARYRQDRRRSESIEWLVTLLSLAAYAAALGIVADGGARTKGTRRFENPADRGVIASA